MEAAERHQAVIAELAESKQVKDKDMRAFEVAQKKMNTLLERFHSVQGCWSQRVKTELMQFPCVSDAVKKLQRCARTQVSRACN